MKILFDECVPRTLKFLIDAKHDAVWVQDANLQGTEDGDLLVTAVAFGFDVFVTVDQNIPYQQSLGKFAIAFVQILTLSNAAPRLKMIIPQLNKILETIKRGDSVILKTAEYEEMERRRNAASLPPYRSTN